MEEFSMTTGEGYEVITCLGNLHHMPNLDRVAASLVSLLCPGGILTGSLEKARLVLEQARFKNTFMRVLEGMLFRESAFDCVLYRLVRWVDNTILDPLSGKRAGAALLLFRKP